MFFVNVLFAWFILSTDIIMGIAYTAPFSAWSYCSYLGKTMPMSIITILLLTAGYYNKRQRKIEVLTFYTPVAEMYQLMIRIAVLGVCFLFIYLVIIALAIFFYIYFFQFYNFGIFLLPSLFMILPCFTFFIGFGHLIGKIHQSLIYILIFVVFIAGCFQIPYIFDFFGVEYFSTYPLSLPIGINEEPAFKISAAFGIVQIIYLCTGFACIGLRITLLSHKPRRA